MFKKKQVLAMVGIAILSFVIGSMFNVMANDSGGNPWDKVWTSINELESKVETLEAQLPQQGFLTAPAYDSGWIDVWGNWGTHTFEHGLNTTDVFVYILRKHSHNGIQPFWAYEVAGGNEYWRPLTRQNITLFINMAGGLSDEIRIRMWIIPEP